jgi:hypothetical protein
MRGSLAPVMAFCGLLVGCSGEHRFEVAFDGPDAERAELTLYGETTPMARTAEGFTGTRRDKADGSGRIVIYRSSGEPIICPIGYVANGEAGPHRFVVRDDVCNWSQKSVSG